MSIRQVSPLLDEPIMVCSHLGRTMPSMNINRKVTTTIVGVTLAGVLTLGAAASATGPDGSSTGAGKHPRKEYICTHQTEVADRLAKVKTTIEGRIAMATEHRSAAEAAGDTEAVARLDKRLARLNKALDRVTKRAEGLPAFIAANCDAPG
jgi:hypothetical protein